MSSRRKKKRFGKRKHMNEEMVLQITSMADIFTIILVFLLKSFATGASSISPSADIILPPSVTSNQVQDMPKLEISERGILLEDKLVDNLTNFRFQTGQIESDGTARALNTALQDKQRSPSSVQANANGNGAQEGDPKATGILVLADKKTPYTTIKTVLDTVAANGISEFKLLVVEDQ